MHNHITNRIQVRGDSQDLKDFKEKVRSKDNLFDFREIIPIPDYVFQGDLPHDWKPNGKYKISWYDWNVKNWGTKWGAYDVLVSKYGFTSIEVVFDTAWSTPEPIWERLAEIFPRLRFRIDYADEDIGFNCGTYFIRKGKIRFADREGNRNFALRVKKCSKWERVDMFEKQEDFKN